jgi:predicted O-methyltransferase YrrM
MQQMHSLLRRRIRPGLERRLVKLAAKLLPPRLRSAKQLAREARQHGAMQKPAELSSLLRLLRDRPPRTIVEIGTAAGGTLYAFCQVAAKGSLIISIDLPGGEFGGGYGEEQIPGMQAVARKDQSIHFLRCDSHEASTLQAVLAILASRSVDFLFIDGDHSYEGVAKDFEMYGPLVADGGVVAFHDIVPHPKLPECEVDRFWDGVKRNHPHYEYVQPGDWGWGPWGGIGVLEIR